MKTYEVSLEKGKFNKSTTIESALFENLEEARKIFDMMNKRVKESEVLYLMQSDVIDFKEGEQTL